MLWSINYGGDAGRGLAGDIDPRHPGAEMWGIPGGLYNIKGEVIHSQGPRMTNFAIWWDGDELREMVDRNRIAKWNWNTGRLEDLLVAEGCQAAAGTNGITLRMMVPSTATRKHEFDAPLAYKQSCSTLL